MFSCVSVCVLTYYFYVYVVKTAGGGGGGVMDLVYGRMYPLWFILLQDEY